MAASWAAPLSVGDAVALGSQRPSHNSHSSSFVQLRERQGALAARLVGRLDALAQVLHGRLFGSGVRLFAQSGVLEPQVASLATRHCYRMALLLAPAVLAQRRVYAHVVLPQGVDIAPAGIAYDSHGYSLPSGFTAPARNHARRLSAHSGHKALALPSIRALFPSTILA
jgi:hypothetical protein